MKLWQPLTSNAGHLGWQHMRSYTKWHLWRQITIPLMRRDQLVGSRYFVPFFAFYTESVILGPRFIPESVFYTQSVMLSPCFILESVFYTQTVVRSPQSVFYTDRLQPRSQGPLSFSR